MNEKMKMKKTFFDNYPLREKVGKANFIIKLESGSSKLRYSPEQFGKGLDKTMKELLRTTERQVLNSLQMHELQALPKEDRLAHVEWVLGELDTFIRARIEYLDDAVAELYN